MPHAADGTAPTPTATTRAHAAALWQRAAQLHLPQAPVEAALSAWLETGGTLGVVGPSGAGRTHTLARVAVLLRERGRVPLALLPGPHAGAPIARLLQSPALAGPARALPAYRSDARRARAAASALRSRAAGPLWVLVDDVDRLDPVSLATLRWLAAAEGVGILVAGSRAPAWVGTTVPLAPLDPRAARSMIQRLLGAATLPPALLAHVGAAATSIPGDMLARLAACVQEGRLVPGPTGWRLRHRPCEPVAWNSPARLAGLPAESLALGALVARSVAGFTMDRLPPLLGCDSPEAVRALALPLGQRRLVQVVQGRLRCVGPAARGMLLDAAPAPTDSAWLRLLRRPERAHHTADPAPPSAAFDLEALAHEDPACAARLGQRLLARSPTARVAQLTAEALATTGEDRALVALLERLAETALGRDCELWSRLARLRLEVRHDRKGARDALRVADRLLDPGDRVPLALTAAEAAVAIAEDQPAFALSAIRRALGPEGPLPEPHEHRAVLDLHLLEARALAALGDLDAALHRLSEPPSGLHEEDQETFLLEAARMLSQGRRHLEASETYAAAAALDPAGRSRVQIHWLEQAAHAAHRGGDPSAAVARWFAAETLAAELGETSLQQSIRITAARVRSELCQHDEALALARSAHATAVENDEPAQQVSAAIVLGDIELHRRGFDAAEHWYTVASAALGGPGSPRQRARLLRRLAQLAVAREQPDAEAAVQAAAAACKRAELVRDRARLQGLQAICDARMGRTARIAPTVESAVEPLRARGEGGALAEVRVLAAHAWLIAGNPDAAQAAAARALVWAEESGHVALRTRAEDLCDQARTALHSHADDQAGLALDRLLEVSIALAAERELDTLLARINRAALDLIAGDRAFVLLLDEAGVAHVHAAASAHGMDPGAPSRSIVRSALDRGREIIVSDIDERQDYRNTHSLVGISVRSAMCMPMVDRGRALGLLYVDSRHVGRRELSEATRLLRGLAGHAAIAVANARLLAESTARARRAAEVAHDLRSPAASILMAAREVAEEPEVPGWVAETASLIADQSDKLIKMAERFLAGRPTEARPVDLVDHTKRLVRMQAPAARSRDRSIIMGTADAASVFVDPEELDRALTNLISNAVRHTPPGTAARITIRASESQVQWIVRDQGPGIDPDLLPHIFTPGTKGEGGEHGLGLGICQRIVAQHEGTVAAANHPEGGAVFTVTLPLLTDTQQLPLD